MDNVKPWGAVDLEEIKLEESIDTLLDWLVELSERNGYCGDCDLPEQNYYRQAISLCKQRVCQLFQSRDK